MSTHLVTLAGGPTDGEVITLGDPWPRYGYFDEEVDGTVHTYAMREGGPPYVADWVDPAGMEDELFEEAGEGEPGPTGPEGPTGPAGPPGEPGEPGRSIVHRGAWEDDVEYQANDVVTHEPTAASYIGLTDLNLNHDPGDPASATNWGLIAQGEPGPAGPEGPEGPPGPTGAGAEVRDDGTPMPARTAINFFGSGVEVTDNAGDDATDVEITGGGGGGGGGGLAWKGVYDEDLDYATDDVVRLDGSAWVAVDDAPTGSLAPGEAPGAPAYVDYVASSLATETPQGDITATYSTHEIFNHSLTGGSVRSRQGMLLTFKLATGGNIAVRTQPSAGFSNDMFGTLYKSNGPGVACTLLATDDDAAGGAHPLVSAGGLAAGVYFYWHEFYGGGGPPMKSDVRVELSAGATLGSFATTTNPWELMARGVPDP